MKPLQPSPEHRIHQTSFGELAQMVDYLMRESNYLDWPDDSPLGPSASALSSTIEKSTRARRVAFGKTPTLNGGLGGTFNEIHATFRAQAQSAAAMLAPELLGNDPAQQARIQILLGCWSDMGILKHANRKETKELSHELSNVKNCLSA